MLVSKDQFTILMAAVVIIIFLLILLAIDTGKIVKLLSLIQNDTFRLSSEDETDATPEETSPKTPS